MGTHLRLSLANHGRSIDFEERKDTISVNDTNSKANTNSQTCDIKIQLSPPSDPNGQVSTDDTDIDIDACDPKSNDFDTCKPSSNDIDTCKPSSNDIDTCKLSINDIDSINGGKSNGTIETSTNCGNAPAAITKPETLNGIRITIEPDVSRPFTEQTPSRVQSEMRHKGQGEGHQYSPLTRTSNPEGQRERLSSISNRLSLVAQASADSALDGFNTGKKEDHKKKTLSLRRVKGSFNDLDLEKLYKSYTVRNKHPLVVVYLAVLSLASLVFLFVAVFADTPAASVESIGQIVTLSGSLLYFLTLLFLVVGPSKMATIFAHPKGFSLAVVIGTTIVINLYFGFCSVRDPTGDVPPLFYSM
ncbi:adenylate cyclase [Elysia marginata]|uniref:Adenylate cyclase n=1 Tax=Elysia marginata TaxID=1093978 RepID=A0AAV4JVJ7_9GAST|nr:adenylate cyclase [Elysia marginata]